jgi:hypothetical protein
MRMKNKDAVIKLAEETFAGDSRAKKAREAALAKKFESDPIGFARFALMLEKLWGKDYAQVGSLLRSKVAAQFFELWGASEQVTLKGDRQFFIDLGKCLSGEIKTEVYSKRDSDIAELIFSKPHLSAKEAVRELSKRDHRITEENFRVRKMRLLC